VSTLAAHATVCISREGRRSALSQLLAISVRTPSTPKKPTELIAAPVTNWEKDFITSNDMILLLKMGFSYSFDAGREENVSTPCLGFAMGCTNSEEK
jgi:hypothetical protein